MKPAVFLDRDGTVIEQVHYLSDPALVRLLPGAARAIAALRAAGFACVLVSNQSALGRGVMSEAQLHAVHDAMVRQLAAEGVAVDGWYFCPEKPLTSDRRVVDHPDRKPGPGMLLRAARELDLDLARSWMVGDMISDIYAGRNAGCCGTILVRSGCDCAADIDDPAIDYVAADLREAAQYILGHGAEDSGSSASEPLLRHSWKPHDVT